MPLKRRITVDWPAMMAAFSARLRENREARGMTRKELAQHLGCAPGTIWNWENSYSYPKPDSIAKLASVLDLTEEFLRTGHDASSPDPSETASATDRVEEAFSSMIEDFRRKVAFKTGMPPSRVRVSVEFLSK
jgi:transcriptional regulator with XRE-family HTH domain